MKPGRAADAVLLAHMLECVTRIAEYTGGRPERFDSSRLIQDAVVRNLQMLTESSQRLSDDIKLGEPQVPWRALSGFRNVLVHAYLGLDSAAVGSVIQHDLPLLEEAIVRMIQRVADPDTG